LNVSMTARKHVHFGGTLYNVFEESVVFPTPEGEPVCPLCKDSRNIWVNVVIEQRGFWDTVMIALCHCGFCNEEFGCRRIDEGTYDVGEESQLFLPLGGQPAFDDKTLNAKGFEPR